MSLQQQLSITRICHDLALQYPELHQRVHQADQGQTSDTISPFHPGRCFLEMEIENQQSQVDRPTDLQSVIHTLPPLETT